jgi:hypothetical protein
MTAKERVAELEAKNARMLDLLERLAALAERRAGIEPPPPRQASRPPCRALTSRHQRRKGNPRS